MTTRAIVTFDIGQNMGFAIHHSRTDVANPYSGVFALPKPKTNGSNGPSNNLLFKQINWINKNFGGIEHIGYENFLVPTGGNKDDDKGFITSPKTIKTNLSSVAIIEFAAEILGVECTPINNRSWKSFWLGKARRGTISALWKALSVAKAKAVGIDLDQDSDDEADAVGQLMFLLNKLEIELPLDKSLGVALIEEMKLAPRWIKQPKKKKIVRK